MLAAAATAMSYAVCVAARHVYRDGSAAVILARERADNPGASVTNTYECLASGVWQKMGLCVVQTTWIEHYDDKSYDGGQLDETFDWVTLKQAGNRLVSPEWRRGSREELERLIGQPFSSAESRE